MFIVDGHNLLWAIQGIGQDWRSFGEVQLCHVLARYFRTIADKGEIVFDGAGPPEKSRFDNITGLEVFFSGLAEDADKVIEEKISANTAPKNLTVVSSDRRLRAAAHARKATSIKSQNFWDNLSRRLSKKHAPPEPAEKRGGLTESETEQWLRFFGIE